VQDVLITAHSIERGFLVLSQVHIGKGCSVGMMSVIMPQTSLDNAVALAALSMVPMGVTLAPNTTWEGSPVRPKEGPLVPTQSKPNASKNRGRRGATSQDADTVLGEPLGPMTVAAVQLLGLFMCIAASWVAVLPAAVVAVLLWQVSSYPT